MLAAIQRGGDIQLIAYLSLAFVAARAVYISAYLADKATLRSSAWAIGILATTALMIVAIAGR